MNLERLRATISQQIGQILEQTSLIMFQPLILMTGLHLTK